MFFFFVFKYELMEISRDTADLSHSLCLSVDEIFHRTAGRISARLPLS